MHKITPAHKHVYTQQNIHTQRHRFWRKHRVEAGSIYSLKSSLPHWGHLFRWGYISCSGLNLAAKWRVPLCSNTGVFTPSESLNQRSYTLQEEIYHVSAICTRVSVNTFGFQPVFFFFLLFFFCKRLFNRKGPFYQCSLWRGSHTLFAASAQNGFSSGTGLSDKLKHETGRLFFFFFNPHSKPIWCLRFYWWQNVSSDVNSGSRAPALWDSDTTENPLLSVL